MSDKPKSKSKRGSIITVGILLALLLFTLTPRCSSIIDLYGQVQILQTDKEQLLAERERLQAEHEKMESLEMVERLAREKLGLVKQGERFLLEVDQ